MLRAGEDALNSVEAITRRKVIAGNECLTSNVRANANITAQGTRYQTIFLAAVQTRKAVSRCFFRPQAKLGHGLNLNKA